MSLVPRRSNLELNKHNKSKFWIMFFFFKIFFFFYFNLLQKHRFWFSDFFSYFGLTRFLEQIGGQYQTKVTGSENSENRIENTQSFPAIKNLFFGQKFLRSQKFLPFFFWVPIIKHQISEVLFKGRNGFGTPL